MAIVSEDEDFLARGVIYDEIERYKDNRLLSVPLKSMASSSRYQSQFFNFVNRQAQKVLDKTSLLLRHAKVTAIWGTQIVLYPVYAVYQAVRVAGRQLKQTVQRSGIGAQVSQMTVRDAQPVDLLAVDAPIHLVIDVVGGMIAPAISEPDISVSKPITHPFAFFFQFFPKFIRHHENTDLQLDLDTQAALSPHHPSDLTHQPPLPIQGVASLIDTHHLVLILEGNVIYDLLTLEQQHKIQQRITVELASHAHRQKAHQLNGVTGSPLPIPPARPTLFAPIRIFRQLMAWIQNSPVALTTNLFKESALNIEFHEPDWFVPQLNPGDFELPKLPSSGDLKAAFGQLPRWTDLEALVWAAVHYFFGEKGHRLNAGQAQLPEVSQSQSLAGAAWLSVADLFGQRSPVAFFQDPLRTSEPQAFLAGGGDVAALPAQPGIRIGQTIQQLIERFLKPKSIAVLHRRSIKTSAEVVKSQASEISAVQPRSHSLDFPNQPAPPSATAQFSDWIETQVTSVDYVKSPWQRVIEWLDRIAFSIETALTHFWNWLTGQNR